MARGHQHTTSWYESRYKALSNAGLIGEFIRKNVLARWRSLITELVVNNSISSISGKYGLTVNAIYKDIQVFDLQGARDDDRILSFTKKSEIGIFNGINAQYAYDKKTGIITYKRVHSYDKLHLVGTELKKHGVWCGKNITKQQIAWLLGKGVMPTGRIYSKKKGSLKLKDLFIPVSKWEQSIDKATHIEKCMVGGREKLLAVDSSRSVQPKTKANGYRLSGICQECNYYLDRCLDAEMSLDCVLDSSKRKEIANKVGVLWVK